MSGEILDLVNTINNMIDQLAIFAAEVTRVAREVGTEGKLGVQAEVENIEGTWQEITCVWRSNFHLLLIALGRMSIQWPQILPHKCELSLKSLPQRRMATSPDSSR